MQVVKDADKIHAAITNDRKISFRYFHRNPDRKKIRVATERRGTKVQEGYLL